MGIDSHKIRNGSTRFVIGGALAIQGSVVPVGVLVNISPPIIGQFQRFRKDDGAPMVDHHKGCNLTRNAPALIIVPDIVSVQAVRDGISPDAGIPALHSEPVKREAPLLKETAIAVFVYTKQNIRHF